MRAEPIQTPENLALYRQAVDEYRTGRSPRELDISLAGLAAGPSSGWNADELIAAAMLHTDVLLRLVKTSRAADAAVNLEAAATLIKAAVERDASRADFARRWRATVAALLHAFRAPDLGSHLRSAALPWLTESGKQAEARAAFEAGLVAEIRAAVAGPLSGTPPKKNAVVPAEARSDLAIAARSFDQALTIDPGFAEAALHLGRVRLLDGHDADAERALLTAAAGPGLPVRYLATMMLGAIAERQSLYADAETQYRAAMTMFRWGQSAPLALSHLLMRTGREADAREALAAHLRATGGRVVEPLRTYLADPDTDLGPTLDLLRAEVWR
jgi:hypothetical protein